MDVDTVWARRPGEVISFFLVTQLQSSTKLKQRKIITFSSQLNLTDNTYCAVIDLCRSPWKLLSTTLSSTRKVTKFPLVKLTQQLKLRRYERY